MGSLLAIPNALAVDIEARGRIREYRDVSLRQLREAVRRVVETLPNSRLDIDDFREAFSCCFADPAKQFRLYDKQSVGSVDALEVVGAILAVMTERECPPSSRAEILFTLATHRPAGSFVGFIRTAKQLARLQLEEEEEERKDRDSGSANVLNGLLASPQARNGQKQGVLSSIIKSGSLASPILLQAPPSTPDGRQSAGSPAGSSGKKRRRAHRPSVAREMLRLRGDQLRRELESRGALASPAGEDSLGPETARAGAERPLGAAATVPPAGMAGLQPPTTPRRRTAAEFTRAHEASHDLAQRALEEFRAHQARAAAYYQQGAGALTGGGGAPDGPQQAILAALRASGEGGAGAVGRAAVTAQVDGRKLLYVVQSVMQGLHVAFGVPVVSLEAAQEIAAAVVERRPDQEQAQQEAAGRREEQQLEEVLAAAAAEEEARAARRSGRRRHRGAQRGAAGAGASRSKSRRGSDNAAPDKGGTVTGSTPGGRQLQGPPTHQAEGRAVARRDPAHEVLRRTKLSLDRLRDFLQSDPGYTQAMRRITQRVHDQLGRHISLGEVFMGGKLFTDDPAQAAAGSRVEAALTGAAHLRWLDRRQDPLLDAPVVALTKQTPLDGGPASARRPPLRVKSTDSVLWALKVMRRRALEDAAVTVAHSTASLHGQFPDGQGGGHDLRLESVFLRPGAPPPPPDLVFGGHGRGDGEGASSPQSGDRSPLSRSKRRRQQQQRGASRPKLTVHPESGQPMGIGRYLLQHALPSHGLGIDAAVRCDHPMYAGGGGGAGGDDDDGDGGIDGDGGNGGEGVDGGHRSVSRGARRPFSKASSKGSAVSSVGDGHAGSSADGGGASPRPHVPFASLMHSLQSVSRRNLQLDREADRHGMDIDPAGTALKEGTAALVQDSQELLAAADQRLFAAARQRFYQPCAPRVQLAPVPGALPGLRGAAADPMTASAAAAAIGVPWSTALRAAAPHLSRVSMARAQHGKNSLAVAAAASSAAARASAAVEAAAQAISGRGAAVLRASRRDDDITAAAIATPTEAAVLSYPSSALVYDPRPRDRAWRVQRALDRLEGGSAPMGRCMGLLDSARMFNVLMRTICDRLRTQRRAVNAQYFRACQAREEEERQRGERTRRVAGLAARVARYMLQHGGSIPAEAQPAKARSPTKSPVKDADENSDGGSSPGASPTEDPTHGAKGTEQAEAAPGARPSPPPAQPARAPRPPPGSAPSRRRPTPGALQLPDGGSPQRGTRPFIQGGSRSAAGKGSPGFVPPGDPEEEAEKREAREAAARGVQAALQLLEELGGSNRRRGRAAGGTQGKGSPRRTARAGPSDVLTVGGGGPPNGSRGRAPARSARSGQVRAGSVVEGPTAWLAAGTSSRRGTDGDVHGDAPPPVVRYGSGKRLGQLIRRGVALAAGEDGAAGGARRSRSRKRRGRRGRRRGGSRGGSRGGGRRGSPSSRSQSPRAGGGGPEGDKPVIDPAGALQRAHKGGRALTSEESTELAAALASSAVRNRPILPVRRPPYTPLRATDPADCSPKALLASCPGTLLRQIIEEEGAAWCQRGVGSVMTTTAQGGELPRPRHSTRRRGSELESVIRAAAEGVDLGDGKSSPAAGAGDGTGLSGMDALSIRAAIRRPGDASSVLAAQFQSRVSRVRRGGGLGGTGRSPSPVLTRQQRAAMTPQARRRAVKAAQEKERTDAAAILGARRVDVHFHQRRAERALVQSGIALFTPLHGGQALYSAAILLATQATHVPVSPDAASSPHAVTAVTDQLSLLRYLQGRLPETIGAAGEATVRRAQLGRWTGSLPSKEKPAVSFARFQREAAKHATTQMTLRQSGGQLAPARQKRDSSASRSSSRSSGRKPRGGAPKGHHVPSITVPGQPKGPPAAARRSSASSSHSRRGSVTMAVGADALRRDDSEQAQGLRYLQERLLGRDASSGENGSGRDSPSRDRAGSPRSTRSAASSRASLQAQRDASDGPSSPVELEYLSRLISVPHTCTVLEAFIGMHLRGVRAVAVVQAPPLPGEGAALDRLERGSGRRRVSRRQSKDSTGAPQGRRGSGGGLRRRRRRSSVGSLDSGDGGGDSSELAQAAQAVRQELLGGSRAGGEGKAGLGRRDSVPAGESKSGEDDEEAAVAAEEASRWWTGPVIGVLRVSHLPLLVPHLPNHLFEALLRPVGDMLGLRLVSTQAMEWRDAMVRQAGADRAAVEGQAGAVAGVEGQARDGDSNAGTSETRTHEFTAGEGRQRRRQRSGSSGSGGAGSVRPPREHSPGDSDGSPRLPRPRGAAAALEKDAEEGDAPGKTSKESAAGQERTRSRTPSTVHGSLSLPPGAVTCRFGERVRDIIDRMVLERAPELFIVGRPDEGWGTDGKDAVPAVGAHGGATGGGLPAAPAALGRGKVITASATGLNGTSPAGASSGAGGRGSRSSGAAGGGLDAPPSEEEVSLLVRRAQGDALVVKGVITATDVLRFCLWAWTVRHVKTTTDVAVVGADAKRFGFEVGTRGYAGTFAGILQEAFRERVRRGIVRTSSLYTHARRLREHLGEGVSSPDGGTGGAGGVLAGDKDEDEAQVLQVARHGGSSVEMRLVQAMEKEAREQAEKEARGKGHGEGLLGQVLGGGGRGVSGTAVMGAAARLQHAAATAHSHQHGDAHPGSEQPAGHQRERATVMRSAHMSTGNGMFSALAGAKASAVLRRRSIGDTSTTIKSVMRKHAIEVTKNLLGGGDGVVAVSESDRQAVQKAAGARAGGRPR